MKPISVGNQTSAPGISRATYLSLVVITAIVPMILLVAPAAASQMALQLKLSPAQIGTYFFFELGAFSLGTIPCSLALHRVDGRRIALVAAIVFCLGNLATAWLGTTFIALLVLRSITSLAAGVLNVLCLMTAARAHNPDRLFGVCITGQLIAGAIGLWVFPQLFASFGLAALYVAMGLLGISFIAVARNFPDFLVRPEPAASRTASAGNSTSGFALPVVVVLSVFLFYLAMGGVWTFVHGSAHSVGLDAATAGKVMSIATIMGIIGAGLASYLGGKVNRSLVLWIGYAVMVASILGLSYKGGLEGFVAAVFLFKFGWTFVLPFIFAAAAKVSSARLFGTLSLFVGGGLAFGPLIGGFLIQATGSSKTLYVVAAIATAVSAVMLNRIAAVGKSTPLSVEPGLQNQ
ncbi:MFS transporter [Caballeronia hypogeia]|uniref:MFS transporter n=1 Tax=Caballeronia hypogeia TaxID=1777140 RepID=A0A158CJA2_9BURK|nr:MFS transporter [Caballeronia hypogeia]SAK82350.1 MFS transporter [Caballeronia hypogeia]